MSSNQPPSKDNFLYPRSRYHGSFSPQRLAFNANLQEFAAKVSYACALETGGKVSSQEAYEQIKALWKNLKQSREGLGLATKDAEEDN